MRTEAVIAFITILVGVVGYPNIIFDLDGTLIDSQEGIFNSIRYALRHFNIEEDEAFNFKHFIGPSLFDSFEKHYVESKEEAIVAVNKFREYYSEKGVFETVMIPGISKLLRDLNDKSDLYIATAKPTVYSLQIAENLRFKRFFIDILGCELSDTEMSKKVILGDLLKRNKQLSSNACYIGDRASDIEAAKYYSLDSIAVGFGYGTRNELKNAGPDQYVDTVEELSKLLSDK